jgi:hypothetical protein
MYSHVYVCEYKYIFTYISVYTYTPLYEYSPARITQLAFRDPAARHARPTHPVRGALRLAGLARLLDRGGARPPPALRAGVVQEDADRGNACVCI